MLPTDPDRLSKIVASGWHPWQAEWNNPPRYDVGPIRYGSGPMSEYEFVGRCKYLFGEKWRSIAPLYLSVEPKTVWRWRSDPSKIPGPAIMAIRALWACKRHGIPISDDYGQPIQ